MQPLVQLLPINKAAACSHVYSASVHIHCRLLAYTDSFSTASEEQNSTVSVSIIYFLCEYSECVRYSRAVPNGTVIVARRENAFWHYRI